MIENFAAQGVPIQVVAAKLPGEWIIRAIGNFDSADSLRRRLRPYVALVRADDIEWSQHRYHIPWYLAYGSGELEAMGRGERGIWLFRHLNDDTYGPAERLES